uniref:50S ribosomal protein L35 n=1 Tax=Nitzschia alba TaxID=2858 RepID=A0A5C0F4W8_NITAL|nr:50S ribosomal protein L35 [Nitzschia alba]QEI59590.1 50S ribosomal protein L35 [Nitzschia alba]
MIKLKTLKAAHKRYKITRQNNFICKHAGKGHLLLKKSKPQKLRLSKPFFVNKNEIKNLKLILIYR